MRLVKVTQMTKVVAHHDLEDTPRGEEHFYHGNDWADILAKSAPIDTLPADAEVADYIKEFEDLVGTYRGIARVLGQ